MLDFGRYETLAASSILGYPTGAFRTIDGNSVVIVGWDKREGMPLLDDGRKYFPCCIENPLYNPSPQC